MLLDTVINEFIRKHYFESIYEITTRKGDCYAEIAVDTQEKYFYCSFCMLDAERRMFTVFCEHNNGRSYAYRLNKDNLLVDIRQELFSAREILTRNVHDPEMLHQIDTALSDQHNIDLFYEKLIFRRGKYGNQWFIELAPLYDEPQLDEVFLAASNIGMLWDKDEAKFIIRENRKLIGQSAIDCSHGVVSINNCILFMIANPGVRFNLVQYIPLKTSADTLVCEGEIEIPDPSGEGSETAYCKFSVSSLKQLPATNIVVRINDEEVTGTTPVVILSSAANGMLHSALRQQSLEESVDEMTEIINEYVPTEFIQSHVEHLHRTRDKWNVSPVKQLQIFAE